MFITHRKVDIIAYFMMSIILGLTGKRYIYGGLIFAFTVGLLIQKQVTDSPGLAKFQSLTFVGLAALFLVLLISSLYVVSKTTSVSDKQKLVSIVFLILSLAHSVARNLSTHEIFTTEISKYASTLLMIVVLFTVGFIPDNQLILHMAYTKEKGKVDRF
jgi:hypothetical protein